MKKPVALSRYFCYDALAGRTVYPRPHEEEHPLKPELPRIARFEKVSIGQFREAAMKSFPDLDAGAVSAAYEDIALPRRATAGSSGYDIRTPFTFTLKPGEDIVIPTGIRVWIAPGWWLMLMPRSGLGFKFYTRLANTVGNIDSDYYGADNEGHIMVKLRMELDQSGAPRTFEAGTAVCQGVFVPFGVTEDDDATEKRTGGFGSTGK